MENTYKVSGNKLMLSNVTLLSTEMNGFSVSTSPFFVRYMRAIQRLFRKYLKNVVLVMR